VTLAPPGASPRSPDLAARLAAAVDGHAPGWTPRTRHREGNAPRFANRLALESSPYLLQHAHNPVDWRPWGEEAFAEARASRRPVFLSIGYSTCHWCHVMEEESFEDLEIAEVLNRHFVPIKVDREERPDVDAVYMVAVQALTGGGGWPMSVWLDGNREPFFGGTYFPARDGDRGAPRGFLSLLRLVVNLWERDPLRVSQAAGSLAAAVRTALSAAGEPSAAVPGPETVDAAVAAYRQMFDESHGGLRGAPKFPSSLPVRLLLRAWRRSGDAQVLRMATRTLERMAAGGIHDQLGGGFHRYSTDERWLVPHFEKMLYDNALLAVAYAEAFQATGRADFARVLRSTLDYLLREMQAPRGAFFSATDADSEGEEGRFFAWTEEEIRRRLGAEAQRFVDFHGVTPEGHFEAGSILHVPAPDEGTWEALGGARETLRLARESRVRPLRDEKVLTSWNGLTLSALALGGRVLGEPRYLEAGARAAGLPRRPRLPGPGAPRPLRGHLRAALALRGAAAGRGDRAALRRPGARWVVRLGRGPRAAHRPGAADPRRRRALGRLGGGAQRPAARRLHLRRPLAGAGRPGLPVLRGAAGPAALRAARAVAGARLPPRRRPRGGAGVAAGPAARGSAGPAAPDLPALAGAVRCRGGRCSGRAGRGGPHRLRQGGGRWAADGVRVRAGGVPGTGDGFGGAGTPARRPPPRPRVMCGPSGCDAAASWQPTPPTPGNHEP